MSGGWRTSSACASGACVEVQILPGCVCVRHSAEPDVWVEYTRAEWSAHLAGVKNGEFDLPDGAEETS